MAVGFAKVVLFKPVAGAQLYVVAPLAAIAVLVPSQIVVVPEALTFGIGLTVTVTFAVLLHPFVVPVTV